jgi:prepilin-type N-terminal cleavage/methylation domain-containing protein
MMKSLKKKRKGGFTLIELIVVIAILAILAAVAIPRLMDFTKDAEKSADAASESAVNSAWAIYEADSTKGTWPDDYLQDAAGDGTTVTIGAVEGVEDSGTSFTYNAGTHDWSIVAD